MLLCSYNGASLSSKGQSCTVSFSSKNRGKKLKGWHEIKYERVDSLLPLNSRRIDDSQNVPTPWGHYLVRVNVLKWQRISVAWQFSDWLNSEDDTWYLHMTRMRASRCEMYRLTKGFQGAHVTLGHILNVWENCIQHQTTSCLNFTIPMEKCYVTVRICTEIFHILQHWPDI